jgi:hypothetical protein
LIGVRNLRNAEDVENPGMISPFVTVVSAKPNALTFLESGVDIDILGVGELCDVWFLTGSCRGLILERLCP